MKKEKNERHSLDIRLFKNVDISFNLGNIFKRRRLELKMTQDEVSQDICSISYLSKIESNQIIPNTLCKVRLMERMELTDDEIFFIENEQDLVISALESFYLLDIEGYYPCFESVSDVINNQSADIIKLGYYILTNDTFNASKIIRKNRDFQKSFDKDILKIFNLFKAEYYYQIYDYIKAYESLYKIDSYEPDYRIDLLIKDLKFRLAVMSNDTIIASDLFKEIIYKYSLEFHLERMKLLKIKYISLLFQNKEYDEVIKNGVSPLSFKMYEGNDEYYSMIGVSLYESSKEIPAKEYLERINKKSKYYSKYIEYIYNVSSHKQKFIESVINLNSEDPNFYLSFFIAKIKNDIKIELFDSDLFKKCYASATKAEKRNLLSLKVDYLKKSFKYKESVELLELFNGN